MRQRNGGHPQFGLRKLFMWTENRPMSLHGFELPHPERWTHDRPVTRKVIALGKPPGLCSTTTCGTCDLCESITSFDEFGHLLLHDGSVHVTYKFYKPLEPNEYGSPISSAPEVVCFGNSTGITTGTKEACKRMFHDHWDVRCSERGDRLCVFSGQYQLTYRPWGSTRTIPIRAYASSVETEYFEYRNQTITCNNSQIISPN
ncbi:hypothetical protein DdX_13531 [Ditylenchus destructor]|uniref:Uncharacterized protein n=1 Tax=Ditylenchus destructor TaxID=166010 RepID=A0AAD4QZF8_9BILA|nr:hypothetical protein DdX_13531 [Ditylenchus destructor]